METSHYFRLYQALSSSLSFYNVNCTYDAFTEIYSFIHSFTLYCFSEIILPSVSQFQKNTLKILSRIIYLIYLLIFHNKINV